MTSKVELAAKVATPVMPGQFQIWAQLEASKILHEFDSNPHGLTDAQARARLFRLGPNEVATEKKVLWTEKFISNIKDPLTLLLLVLAVVAYATGDYKATVLIIAMLLLSVALRLIQEFKADKAAEKLKGMVRTTATVLREEALKEIPLAHVVTGDIVHLSAGDMVPADVRLLESTDLFINQSALTGEALPAEKHAPAVSILLDSNFELPNMCFMGTNVESGTAKCLVVSTGRHTMLGQIAEQLDKPLERTSFDLGINKFTWLMIRFIFVMTPLVLLINGFLRGDWLEASLFALAVAVGLTPELLPMIVTVNLSKGALDLERRKVIVKKLRSVQNFGAMNILCTDKTGTLTEGKVALIKHVNIKGEEDEEILNLAFLNSYFQTGLKNLLDEAILNHEPSLKKTLEHNYKKIDEIPFDFIRRRMSVVAESATGEHILICKGAVEEILSRCTHVEIKGKRETLEEFHHESKNNIIEQYGAEGFRLVAVAYKNVSVAKKVYTKSDESDLILMGFLGFLDPPKASAKAAIASLEAYGVTVKVLTGDSGLVTHKVCEEVGLSVGQTLSGSDIARMTDMDLEAAVKQVAVFHKLEPIHKVRVIQALKAGGNVVGFMGDGINDAPALRQADVGISVDTAVDVAKESSEIILLEKSLAVLKDGVCGGRRIFANILKYLKMTASSNFGNMLSVVGGSIFLPFLPMLPLQVIANNMLYDLSQASIPTDKVDDELIMKPKRWNIDNIQKYILVMGPVSSLFDYVTYGLMLYTFNAWNAPSLFHTGWFIESLLTQTLIVHVIRTHKLPFFQSRASLTLTVSTIAVAILGIWLPYSKFAGVLGFVPLPTSFWPFLAVVVIAYAWLAHMVNKWFARNYENLP